MSDPITAEEAGKLLDEVAQNQPRVCLRWCLKSAEDCLCYKAQIAEGALYNAAPDLARTVIALHADRDRLAAAIREAALREAADVPGSWARTWKRKAERTEGLESDGWAEDAQTCFDLEAEILALIDNPPHVNETPKTEHDREDVLTPDATAIREAARALLNWRDAELQEAINSGNELKSVKIKIEDASAFLARALSLIDKPGKENRNE